MQATLNWKGGHSMSKKKSKNKKSTRYISTPASKLLLKASTDTAKNTSPSGKIGSILHANHFILLAFIIPFFIMTSTFAIMKVAPFGNKQILVIDLWQQYFPFLADFQDKLKHGESLLWSWTQGGGANYLALASYYLISPFNFLSVLVPAAWLREYLMVSVSARIALAGMFMAIFLRSVYKKDDLSLTVFGCCFSFCAFLTGYYWNVIWLDTVSLTPLVALGTVKLLTENRFRLFVISLALSLFTNFYIGYFSCIFVLLIFISYQIVHWEGIKSFFHKFFKTGFYSLIAIGMTAILLLPAYLAISNTRASSSGFPPYFSINIGEPSNFVGILDAMRKILSNFLTFSKPNTVAATGLPNIACGTGCMIFGLFYLGNQKIPRRERICAASLILFMCISFISRKLDYIWHGFHFTNGIPYRFSYLVSFLLVVMAFRAFTLLENVTRRNIFFAAIATAVVILLGIGVQDKIAIITTACVAAGIFILIYLSSKKIVSQQVLLLGLSLIVFVESGASAYIGVKAVSVTNSFDYPKGEEVSLDVIKQMNALETNTPELWRAEMTAYQTHNDASLNGYNGLTLFSFMANEDIAIFFEKFGLIGRPDENRYGYTEGTPVANLFMNIKYLIARDGFYSNHYDMEEVYESSGEKLLLNTHYLPMGFMVSADLLEWGKDSVTTPNPLEQQNEFFKTATGIKQDVFIPLDVSNQDHTALSMFPVTEKEPGVYSYNYSYYYGDPQLKWDYKIPADGLYCLYLDIPDSVLATVCVNNQTQFPVFDISYPHVFSCGYYHKGDKVSVTAYVKKAASGRATIHMGRLDSDIFEQGYALLSQDVMTTTSFDGTYMEGSINVSKDGLFYTSIPYEKGWMAIVDGNEAEIEPVGGAMLAFRLPAGTHSIRLVYCPNGFKTGCIISLVSIFLFTCACLWRYRKQKYDVRDKIFNGLYFSECSNHRLEAPERDGD